MRAPEALIHFPGVESFLYGSFTLGHGMGPSGATLYIAPQKTWIPKVGTLTLSYGPVRMQFPGCVADHLEPTVGPDGSEVWALHLLDRRWQWRECGQVSGYYNVRRGSLQSTIAHILSGSEKTPRELAGLCLDALGERAPDLSDMPDDTYPEIEWDVTRPADALGQLCDRLGCRVVLGLRDQVRVCRTGHGAPLPNTPDVISGPLDVDTPEMPDELVLATAPIRWQYDFWLEAVGLEADGRIVPLDDLSYRPRAGWTEADLEDFSTLPTEAYRELAKQSVFRWYRIACPFELPMWREKQIDTLERILPLLATQEDKARNSVLARLLRLEGKEQPLPPWVYGTFHESRDQLDDNAASAPKMENDIEARCIYQRGFQLDQDHGMVRFSEPVYHLPAAVVGSAENTTDTLVEPATLWLRVSVSLRDADTRAWQRREFRRRLATKKSGTRARYIRQDDLIPTIIYRVGKPAEDNAADVQKAAKFYLDGYEREYQAAGAGSLVYAGFKPIEPDGAIRQVTWSVDPQGHGTTTACRNTEPAIAGPAYHERRLYERTAEALRRAAETARQSDEKLKRGAA